MRIKRELQPEIDIAFGKLSGQFTPADEAAAVYEILKKKDLNKYSRDIAAQIAQREDHARVSLEIPKTIDLFPRELADRLIIPIGEKLRVKLIDATWDHLLAKHAAQAKAIAIAQNAWNHLDLLMSDLKVAGMPEHPTMTVGDAMKLLGAWQDEKASEAA